MRAFGLKNSICTRVSATPAATSTSTFSARSRTGCSAPCTTSVGGRHGGAISIAGAGCGDAEAAAAQPAARTKGAREGMSIAWSCRDGEVDRARRVAPAHETGDGAVRGETARARREPALKSRPLHACRMTFLAIHRPRPRRRARRQARLHPRRSQRAAGRRRPHHRRHAHPRLGAVHRDGARRRRRGDGHLASRPPDRRRSSQPEDSLAPVAERLGELLGRDVPLVQDWVDGVARRRPASSCCSRTAASTRARRRTTRRWRRRWPRSATSTSTTRSAPRIAPRPRPTASPSSRRSPAPGRCSRPRSTRSRKALAEPEAAAGRDRRRQQGLDQAEHPAEPGEEGRPADRRRRHRQHLPAGRGPADRQEPGRASPGRRGAGRDRRRCGRAAPTVPIPIDVVVAHEFRAGAAATVKARRRRRRRRPDPRHRPEDRGERSPSMLKSAGTIVWNGPVGVFEFDAFAHGTETDRPRHRRRRRAFSIAGGGDTLAAIAKYGIERRHRLHLDRRRRLPRNARRQDPAGVRDPASGVPRRNDRPCMMRHQRSARHQDRRHARPRVELARGARADDPRRRRRGAAELLARHGAGPHRPRHAGARDRQDGAAREVAIMADLQGPKIRVGKFEGGKIMLEAGAEASCSTPRSTELGTSERVGLDYKELPRDVRARRHRCCSTTACSRWWSTRCAATKCTPRSWSAASCRTTRASTRPAAA